MSTMKNVLRILQMNPRTPDGEVAKFRLLSKAVDALKISVFDHMVLASNELPGVLVNTEANETDFTVQNEGSILIVHAHTKEAQDCVSEYISDSGYQPDYPRSIIVEPRYAQDLFDGIREAGFQIGGF